MISEDHKPVLATAGLTKIFKDFWHRNKVVAVRDLTMEIRPGEVFGLLGPNGSGKSTTIKMILGLLYPTRGRLSVFGRPPTDVSIKSRIGYLPEESYLYRFLNARETMDFYGRLFHLPPVERRRRIDQILDMVGLTHAAYRRVGEYSKGMARRIGLAQALINDPDFLILDEPTTGLDPIGTRQIKDLIRFLRDKGKTVLLSSHLLADVEDVCDRVCILYGGQQQAMGDVRELLQKKEVTQITAEQLRKDTVEEIRALVRSREQKEVGVSAPSDKLEHLFLRIVEAAQASALQTSGAQSGKMAAFLGGGADTGESVIASLVEAGESATEGDALAGEPSASSGEAREPQPASAEPADSTVLASLVDEEASKEEEAPESPVRDAAGRAPAEADHKVIDSLLDSGGQTSPPEERDNA